MHKILLVNRKRRGSKGRKVVVSTARSSRKRRRSSKSSKRRSAHPFVSIARSSRKRRNPIAIRGGGVMGQVKEAAQQAAGALALDLAYAAAPIPPQLKLGPFRHAVKGAAAVLLGIATRRFVSAPWGRNIAMGGLTVALYNAGRDGISRFAPALPMGEYLSDAIDESRITESGEVGEYLNAITDDDAVEELGWMNASPLADSDGDEVDAVGADDDDDGSSY